MQDFEDASGLRNGESSLGEERRLDPASPERVFRGLWNILGWTGIFQQRKSGIHV
jgi:hypothetical protein